MTIKTILCPVDLSPASDPVLRTALAIARREGAQATAMHVLDPLLAQASAMSFEKSTLEHAAMADLAALIRKAVRDVGVRPATIVQSVRFGEPHEAILAAITKDAPDLVVMGTHGFSGARKLFFGSTAARVLARSTRPVLAMPADGFDPSLERDTPAFGLKRLVVAVNFTEAAMRAVEPAADLARKWGLALVLVHIVESAPAIERWREMLDEYHTRRTDRARHELELIAREIEGVPVTVVSTVGAPEDTIVDIAGREPGSLIALGVQSKAHGPSAFQLGSTAYRLLCLTKRPVLIFPSAAVYRSTHSKATVTGTAAHTGP